MNSLESIPSRMLHNFVERYEAGGVQPHPRLRFVDEEGRACIACALVGASSSREFATMDAGREFLGGPLEELSRRFEACRLTAGEMYAGCLMELARRTAAPPVSTPAPAGEGRRQIPTPHARARKSRSSRRPVSSTAIRISSRAPGEPTAISR